MQCALGVRHLEMTTGGCLDGLSLALSQISFTVTELSKKNYKSNVSELRAVSVIMQ